MSVKQLPDGTWYYRFQYVKRSFRKGVQVMVVLRDGAAYRNACRRDMRDQGQGCDTASDADALRSALEK